MKVHLVDGTYELFRSWFGAPRRADAAGREVGAVRGLLATLLSLLREDEVTHAAVAFDTVIESFRNDLYAGYKTGAGLDPDLVAQFPLAEEASRALGVVVWGMIEFEADDALAAGARRFQDAPGVEQVVLCSPDKDLAQCVVEERVVCLDRRRGRMLDATGVVEKFGVEPASIPDWLALVGDAADGYPGIPRWGARSAAAVLRGYRHIDCIPDDETAWEAPVRGASALASSLAARRAEAYLYRRLATLRTDAPIAGLLDDLEWRGACRRDLEDLCTRLEYPELLERVPRWR